MYMGMAYRLTNNPIFCGQNLKIKVVLRFKDILLLRQLRLMEVPIAIRRQAVAVLHHIIALRFNFPSVILEFRGFARNIQDPELILYYK